MGRIKLRQYQQDAIDSIPNSGRYLISMATGLGKTVTFSQIPRQGRMLILAHREELLNQPKQYFDCSYGIEKGSLKSNGEEVIAASVQSLCRRLHRFNDDDFDIIIIDEAHHASAKSYQKIIDHFKPRLLLGVTATANRADGQGLDHIFEKIIFERDIEFGIDNNYLSNVSCKRVNIGYDLSRINLINLSTS